jgi:hypothetical protein
MNSARGAFMIVFPSLIYKGGHARIRSVALACNKIFNSLFCRLCAVVYITIFFYLAIKQLTARSIQMVHEVFPFFKFNTQTLGFIYPKYLSVSCFPKSFLVFCLIFPLFIEVFLQLLVLLLQSSEPSQQLCIFGSKPYRFLVHDCERDNKNHLTKAECNECGLGLKSTNINGAAECQRC